MSSLAMLECHWLQMIRLCPYLTSFTVNNGIPLFVVINGVANTNSHDQWEVVYLSEGFPGTETLRNQINSVQAGADTTPPLITINGETNISLSIGATYSDAGATATDNVDGTLPVTLSNSVDTSVPGSYSVIYSVTDAAGNTATSTRNVIVGTNFTNTATSLGGQWFHHDWFGLFYVKDANWIFHESLGWVYVSTLSTNNSAWLYLGESLGWCWTSSTIFPLFSQSSPLAEGSQSGSTIILVLPALDTSLILRHNLGEKDRSVFLSQKLKV